VNASRVVHVLNVFVQSMQLKRVLMKRVLKEFRQIIKPDEVNARLQKCGRH
jgi:hypothetical protein